ncbi:zinc-binding dehydrogenase [Caulobacter soli]|uniref:zinc-binding dehydrogenase n=1 Tax=Caulobacter soli TaxID=2708539 RepID=UPI0013EB5CA6|nr:zinc-binding dehydrogenase [Caulobacter soli]
MRAVQHAFYGSAEEALKLTTAAPVPPLAPDQVLVRVAATSVNPIDCAVRSGYGSVYWEDVGFVTHPHTPGRDVAGEVVAVGAAVDAYKPGDAVWAGTLSGGSAEFAAIPQDWLAPKPPSLTFLQAGSMPYVALTTWAALVDHGGLSAQSARDKKVIVPRGAGGVGSFAIQLLKAWGAHVASTCSTRNVDLVRSLGADVVVDYTKQDFTEVLKDYDFAFDTAFDCEAQLLGALKTHAGAGYVSIVTPKLTLIDELGLEAGLAKGKDILAERVAAQARLGRRYAWSFMRPNGKALSTIGDLVEAGKIRPVIDRVYGLSQLVEAQLFCETKQAQGKIVIDIAG